MITLVVLFYAEEDWRGARTWAATRAKWESQGETFDIMRLAPKPVPDDENLAALPLFKMEPDPEPNPYFHGYLSPLALNKAFTWDWEKCDLPHGGNWELGLSANAEKNRTQVATAYRAAFKNASVPLDSLEQFHALVPALAELRAAAANRPLCTFDQEYYSDYPGAAASVHLLSAQIMLSKFLTAEALLALDEKRPDVALDDILVQYKLMSGTGKQPMLVSGLVTVGMQAINLPAIYQGLTTHAWNDQQLAELQMQMAPIDFLAQYQNALRGEVCIMVAVYDRLKLQRQELASEFILSATTSPPKPGPPQGQAALVWPDGWIDLLKSRSIDFQLSAMALVDLPHRIVSPKSVSRFLADLGKKRDIWAILAGEAVGPINNAAQKFAIAQMRLDETRIACALERYHFAHGTYPATLEELAPACIEAVPHDIINGKPFHYAVRADGTFELYSVGWNQTDDGGAFAFKKDDPKAIDYENGDWPWPTPK